VIAGLALLAVANIQVSVVVATDTRAVAKRSTRTISVYRWLLDAVGVQFCRLLDYLDDYAYGTKVPDIDSARTAITDR
jgi:hypothetical protein